jgi:hypothetical protein
MFAALSRLARSVADDAGGTVPTGRAPAPSVLSCGWLDGPIPVMLPRIP